MHQLRLPLDYPRLLTQTPNYQQETFDICTLQCDQSGDSLAFFLLAAWGCLLYRYHQEETIIAVGWDFGEPLEKNQSSFDFFPITVEIVETTNFEALFNNIGQQIKENQQGNQQKVQSNAAFINSCLVDLGTLPNQLVFDLILCVDIGDNSEKNSCKLQLIYNKNLFSKKTIERIIGHFKILFNSIINNPDQPINKLPLLTAVEKHKILNEWNDTQSNYIQDKWIHQLFEEQVEKTPDAIAVIFDDEQLTYRELDQKANQLANYLQRLEVLPGDFIGLFLEPSPARIIGLLAILKAGGIYLPLDPTYPQERLKFMVEDSQISILITQEYLSIKLFIKPLKIVNLDTDWDQIEQEFSHKFERKITGENLAYIIYTSGSTGRPKGVLINHQALSSHCQNMITYYQLNSGDRVLQFASFSFDVSLEQILPTLAVGATLILVDAKSLTSSDLNKIITNLGLTVVNFPPVYLTQWLQFLEANHFSGSSNKLRLIISGGESLPLNTVKKWCQSPLENISLINAYGPTETTITAITFVVPKDNKLIESCRMIPIGSPLPNRKTYILDPQKNPVPIGVIGELYIGGESLAYGYLNQLELTQKKFINNPFAPGKLYKTGDLARYLADGNIEFLGRIDNQVKLRGFRIELGEIETILTQHFQVKDAKLMIREDNYNNQRLVAYIIPKLPKTASSEMSHQIREYLKEKLPNYMIPSALIFLEVFPLTPNGKIDYRAFPEPDFSTLKSNYIAPRNPEEKILANLWSQVLKIEKIGINDNFFELGGHSLLATQLISLVRETFKIEISISLLFEYPTITQLSEHLNTLDKNNNSLRLPSIQPQLKQENIPLSFAQQRFWFLQQLNPNNSAYHLSSAFQIKGLLNINALQKSFNEIIKRHEILRTNFINIDGKPVQQINQYINWELCIIDLQSLSNEQREIEAKKIVFRLSNKSFNLATDYLFRVKLLQLNKEDYLLLLTIHHIIFDGLSFGLLFTELKNLYAAYSQNLVSPLAPLPIQYADFILWQKKYLSRDILDSQLNYWKEKLRGTLPKLELPTDYPRPRVQTYQGAIKTFSFSPKLTTQIKSLSHKEGVSLFMILLTVYKVLLYRYSRQEDIIIGTPIAGRNQREIEQLMGCFINTLVLRSDLSNNPSFRELLSRVKTVCLEAYNNPDVPFEKLVEVLQPKRDLSYTPIFQVMFTFQNVQIQGLELLNLTVNPLQSSLDNAKFDLTLSMEEDQGKLVGEWEYNTDLFDSSTIERMTKNFQILLSEIIVDPQQKIGHLSLLTEREKHQLLVEWNQSKSPYLKNICTHQLFEQQVKQTPEAIALIFEGQEISYQTLNHQANQLAYHLQNLGVKLEIVVGIYLESSAEMIITLLAILKAGGTYLPLDPSYPQERINYMLEDAKVSFLVSVRSLIKNLPNYQGQVIFIDENKDNNWEKYQHNPNSNINSNNLAYIIYTSGSTGRPKGVQIEHKSLINLLFYFKNELNITHQDTWLSVTTLSFDIAALEIFLPLITGAKLILVSRQVARDGRHLLNTLNKSKATILQATPSTWQMLLLSGWKGTSNLTMLSGGEALSEELARQLLTRGYCLYNVYGPTETTIWSLSNYISNDQEKITIGRPIANTEIYILDTNLQPVPMGVTGELYLGGDGLARGYLNRPKLTREKFINSPFKPENKLYKTGDLVRYRKDGKVEFLGRIDQQVKIRGFRIELGEIETVLKQHSQVKEVKVIAKNNKQKKTQLVAYIIATSDKQIKDEQNSNLFPSETVTEIRQYLQQRLPNYMIPSAFVKLQSFPLTPNRKIDFRAFPEPDFSSFQKEYIAPRTEIEEILAMIWSEVLNINTIGRYDNFFELGGHSLLGTQIISRIRDKFEVEIPLYLLFECPTIAQLSEHIELSNNLNNSPLLPAIQSRQSSNYLPLSFSQEALWFLTQLEPNSTAYNMSFILEIKGSLNIIALEKSISKVIERHEILRTNFIILDDQPTQIINPNTDFKLPIFDLSNLVENQKIIEAQKNVKQLAECPLDLGKDILFSVQLLKLDSDLYWLSFNIHHIIFDAWSYEKLQQELFKLYQGYSQEKLPQLPPISIQYADFSLWQHHWFTDKNLESELNYWKQQLRGTLPILQLPTDFPRPPIQTHQGDSYSWELSPELTTKIKSFCQEEGVTLFMTLLAVFKILLSRYTAEKDIIVGTPIASRNRTEIENLIGFFINTLALRTNLGENPSFRELLNRVQQVTLDAYSHQDLPFEKLVKELKPERNLSHNPIFQVWFNMINLPKNGIDCDGLQVKSIPVVETMTKFDLSLYIEEESKNIKLEFVYNNLLFKSKTIEGMARHFQKLIEQVIINPENNISSFSLLSEKERYQLTHQPNEVSPTNSFLNFPKIDIEQSISSRFEEQVKKYPDKIALQSKDHQYTYQELNNKANKIAHFLRNLTKKKQAKIALFFDHNVSMIAAMMGVIKAGQIYVPLDFNYPQDRVLYILDNSCAEVILTNDKNLSYVESITKGKLPIININELNDTAVKMNLEISPDSPVYILYTSGSTGKPKGVIQNQRNVLYFVRSHTNNLHISADDNLTLLASYSFDAAIIDIFSALLNGAKLVLFDIKQEGLKNLSEWLEVQKVTIYHSTPTVYRYFIEILENQKSVVKAQLSHLRLVILGGEPVVRKDVELYKRFFADHCLLVNGLGSTECSFYLQYLINKNTKIYQKSVPVGYAFEDTEILLLDDEGNQTDICGEIAIRSPYIALGYWQNTELTKTVFLDDLQGQNKRIYRTGDWGLLRNNGVIECLGRKDWQVKIRGFRIELGEIETVLASHSQVKETVVIDQEDSSGEKRIIAYIVPQDISVIPNSQLQIFQQFRQFLSQKLPNYMIPAKFVLLATLPLTPNGKIARRLLAARDESESVAKETLIAPRNPLELQLSNIWQKVLRIESIGVQDNFFDLGGHSLLAVRLVAEIERALHQKLPLGTLFQFPTVEQLAGVLTNEESYVEAVWPIQSQGSRSPLFFIHVFGRGLKFCRPIVDHLNPDQPVYGLNAQMINTQERIPNRVEDLATYYIRQMRMLQPEGPYFLVGISFGGTVAYEMAQQLQSQGETVALLGLLDTYAPHAIQRRTVGEIIDFYWTHFLKEGVPFLLTQFIRKLQGITQNNLLHLGNLYKNLYVNLTLKLNLSLSEQMQDFIFQQENRQASIMYRPKVYSGNVSLFLAQETDLPVSMNLDPQLGWGKLVIGKLEVYEIPGSHLGMLQDPSVQILAEKLTLAIEKSTN
ncbi:MAG: amino acid adenylation domain-containing protein [Crocosphaera sp.]